MYRSMDAVVESSGVYACVGGHTLGIHGQGPESVVNEWVHGLDYVHTSPDCTWTVQSICG